MNIDLPGRVRNVRLNAADALLPLFEAVVNGIHSVEDSGRKDGFVRIICKRSNQQTLLPEVSQNWADFDITDNGVGFTEANFTSFSTSDSMHKADRGGKGVGRLIWLKTFVKCEVESVFTATEGAKYRRRFDFVLSPKGVENPSLVSVDNGTDLLTTVKLTGFKEPYCKSAPPSLEKLASDLFDHCLEYLVLKTAPQIIIAEQGEEQISLNELFRKSVSDASKASLFKVGEQELKIQHLQLRPSADRQHRLFFCANDRPVKSLRLQNRVVNLTSSVTNQAGERFVYAGYIAGEYLDRNVNQERTAFTMPEETSQLLPGEIGWAQLEEAAVGQTATYLEASLEPLRKMKDSKIRNFISNKAPQYKPLLKHRRAALDAISPDISEDKLDVELYKIDRSYDIELREKQKGILDNLESKDLPENFKDSYSQFLEEWNEAGMSKLAQHVAYRKATLRFLDKNIQLTSKGSYLREDAIHKIIFPLKSTSDDLRADQMNLWMLDERLAFHHYLSSDIPFTSMRKDIIDSSSKDRPDIAIFNRPTAFSEGDAPFNSVVLIEFKRPSRDDYTEDENPISQVLDYTEQITAGTAKDRVGKPLRVPDGMPFYAYILADLTTSLEKQCRQHGLYKTSDGLGYFGYMPNHRTYIEVLSFDKMIGDAEKRNAKLFEQLGILS